MRPHVSRSRGSAIMVLVCFTVLLMGTLAATFQIVASGAAESETRERGVSARLVAEAGLEWAVSRLHQEDGFRGVRERRFGAGGFDVEVETVKDRPGLRRVCVTARVPSRGGQFATETLEAAVRQCADGHWVLLACSFGSGRPR